MAIADVIKITDYTEVAQTVTAPAVAPLLYVRTAQTLGNWSAGTFDFGITLVGWNEGETLMSPTVSYTPTDWANNKAGVPILIGRAPRGTNAIGWRLYSRKDGGQWREALYWANMQATIYGFGDRGSYGGICCQPISFASGKLYSASNTALNRSGSAIPDPLLTPSLTVLSAIPKATTLYAAFSWVGADGAETALSPASAAASTDASYGGHVALHIREEIPSAATGINVYLSTDGLTWHRQLANVAVSQTVIDVYSYDAAGAAPNPGAPQSLVSPFQQAYDQLLLDGGGHILVGAGPWPIKIPLKVRLCRVGTTNEVRGAKISSAGGHQIGGNSPYRLYADNSFAGQELVIMGASDLLWENLDTFDPSSKCKYGLVLGGRSGGGGFTDRFWGAHFEANATDGVGLTIGPRWLDPNSHSASEAFFEHCGFVGRRWGMRVSGHQSVSNKWQDCWFSSDGPDADSGDCWLASADPVLLNKWEPSGGGQFLAYITNDDQYPWGGGVEVSAAIEGGYAEYPRAKQAFFISRIANNAGRLILRQHWLQNYTGDVNVQAIVAHGASKVLVEAGNIRIDGDIWRAAEAEVVHRYPGVMLGSAHVNR